MSVDMLDFAPAHEIQPLPGRRRGRISARIAAPTLPQLSPGTHAGFGPDGTATLYVPSRLPEGPLPLLIAFHGAFSTPAHVMAALHREAEKHQVLVLAPKSRAETWDVICGDEREVDVSALDASLTEVFSHFAIDPQRVSIAGFSDGASYALCVGLMNGEKFRSIAAWSPGFIVAGARSGRPSVFISHGIDDDVLPIDGCGRKVAKHLITAGYEVRFFEFDGGHELPAEVVSQGFELLAAPVTVEHATGIHPERRSAGPKSKDGASIEAV